MSADRTGQAIVLRDIVEGGPYHDEYVTRGHVDDATHREAVADMLAYEWDEDPEPHEPSEHTHARWVFSRESDCFERLRELRTGYGPGRGAFPVTVSESTRLVESRRAFQARKADALARTPERWPDAYDIEPWAGTARDGWSARFRLPGLAHPIRWDGGGDGQVFVTRGDIESGAWDAYVVANGIAEKTDNEQREADDGRMAG